MRIEIVPVQTKQQWHDFHHVPYTAYAGDPNWVAPLLLERKFHFQAAHNPYFQHATAAFFLAYKDGKPVGRITAQVDRLHLERYNDASGHFGFIDAIDDAEVFNALLTAAQDWLRAQGMTRAIGPVSFSLWDQPGLLVEGFDTPPSVMMAHARPYYEKHIVANGYQKAEDLICYWYDQTGQTDTMNKVVARSLKRGNVTLRNIRKDKKNFGGEVTLLLDIINDAWSDNWGYVPMTRAEIDDLAGILKILLREGDVAIAEHDGRPVAFAAVFPNLNEAIRDMNGHLFPFNWIKLLWRLLVTRTKTVRVPMMGVRKEFHNSTLGAAMAMAVIRATRNFNVEHGVTGAELSWILERNVRMRHIIERGGARAYKTYRIYEKPI